MHVGALRPGVISGDGLPMTVLPAGDDWAERRVGGMSACCGLELWDFV